VEAPTRPITSLRTSYHARVPEAPAAGAYPAHWETDVVLGDGSVVHLRPIRPDDRERLRRFHGRQSRESIYSRYFRFRPELSEDELTRLTHLDYRDRMAFVALLGEELVAVARYERWPDSDRAEVAFFVDDAHNGKGLATIMLEYLAAAARSAGLAGFTASILPENVRMLAVFRRAGFDVRTRFEEGVIEVELGIELTPQTSAAIDERDRLSQARSVARLLRPGSVAVVGVNRRRGRVGRELYESIRAGGFTGPVFAVNQAADEIDGQVAYRSVADIPDEVDLAVLAVPAGAVEATVEGCVDKRVTGLVVVSSGFAETGPEGAERERRLVALARRHGVRLIGPGAFGVVNTDPTVSLNALFVPVRPAPGRVALLSQSGPLGAAVLEQLRRANVGVSSFVGVGNRADVSVNDLLQYWSLDESTDVVLLYLESYGNLRKLGAIARAVSATKPVVAVRPSGGPDGLYHLLVQAGVIVVDSVAEMAEVARVATARRPPDGDRVAVVSNASSVARLAAGAARRAGLQVVVPRDLAAVGGDGPVLVDDTDAVSLQDRAGVEGCEPVLRAAASSGEVDAVVAAIVPTLDLAPEAVARLLEAVAGAAPVPVLSAGLLDEDQAPFREVPAYVFPEDAVRPLGHLARWVRWRRRPRGEVVSLSAGEAEAARSLAAGLLGGDAVRVLDPLAEAPAFLRALGLPVARSEVVASGDEAVAAADGLGYPVALKAGGMRRRSVGEGGGTALDLHSAGAVAGAHRRMRRHLGGQAMALAVVQEMVPVGPTVSVELEQDPQQGAFVRLGVGGAVAAAVPAGIPRIIPVSDLDAGEQIDRSGVGQLVDRTGRHHLCRLVQALSALAVAVPELSLVRLNPVMVSASGATAVDVEAVLRPWPRDPLAEVRHL
jgi:acyl-CoA synthetase (NDP forming)/RimJ/RimL family protein N-acetyltransferase